MTRLNRIVLMGSVCSDVDSKVTSDGTAYSNFVLEVDRPLRSDGTASGQDKIKIVAWRDVADLVKNVGQGQSLLIEGRIITRQFDEEGVRKYVTEVEASHVIVLGGVAFTQGDSLTEAIQSSSDQNLAGNAQPIVQTEKKEVNFDFEDNTKNDIEVPDFSKTLEEEVPF